MHLRRDALAAAAEWIAAVEDHAHATAGLVATVGKIAVTPNAGNVIAGNARLSLDVRHMHDATRAALCRRCLRRQRRLRRGAALSCDRRDRWISRQWRWTSG